LAEPLRTPAAPPAAKPMTMALLVSPCARPLMLPLKVTPAVPGPAEAFSASCRPAGARLVLVTAKLLLAPLTRR